MLRSSPRSLTAGHRFGPLLTGLALLLLVGSFALTFVLGERTSVAEGLGYPGDTLRVVATADTEMTPFVGSERLTSALTTFAADRRMSVAFSPSNAANVLTLLDPEARFAVAAPHLLSGLVPGDGQGTALVSTLLAEANRPAVVPDGVALTGLFTPSVAFDSYLPAVVLDVDAAPFTSGIFLFAGATVQEVGPVVDFFGRHGMQVQDATVYEVLTLTGALGSAYGVFVLLMAAVVAIAGLSAVHIDAALERQRLIAAAVLGASRKDLRTVVLRHAAPPLVAGTGIGTAVLLVGVLATRDTLLAPIPVTLLALLIAVGICVAVWVVVLGWVATWEVRRCGRAVPC